MILAALLIPPSLDAKQALRLRRVGLAALSYVLASGLVAIAWAFGVLPASAALAVVAAYLTINLGLYAVIRSGFNLRFGDPSLTVFQILAAITVLMYVVYHMDEGRNIALFSCFVVFLFGIYRLNVREFTVVMLYTIAAYALVINLLMHLRPQAIQAVPLEWLSWLGLAGLLPCFAVIGGQINSLRRSLRESEVRFRETFELAGSGIAHVGLDGRFVRVNRSLCAIFGYSDKELVGRTVKEFSHPEDRDTTDAARARVRSGELESMRAQKRYLRKDGATVWVDLTVAMVRNASGKPLYEIAVFDDETERMNAESALRDSSEKLRLFADNVPAITTYWDDTLHCRFANRVFTEFWGLAAGEIVGRSMQEIYGEELFREVEVHARQALQGNPVTYQRTRKLADGECRYLEIRLVPQIGDQGRAVGYFAVTTDITEHKLAEERLQRVAHHDSLTGLPNRLLFNDRLSQAIAIAKRTSRRFALLYMDLDKFKPVNDALGHNAGDELLQALAARIRKQVRDSDTVARVGGDEFTVILSDIATRGEAETVARKIVAAIAPPFLLGDRRRSVAIGVSIGVAIYPQDAVDADGLVKAADAAMYEAKKTACNGLSARIADRTRAL